MDWEESVSAYAKLEFADFSFFIQTLTLVVGRKAKAHDNVDVHLGGSKAISRNHARIYYHFAANCWEVEVLGKNGAFVNDRYVEAGNRAELRNNDRIQIAEVGFLFLLPESGAAGLADDGLMSLPMAMAFGDPYADMKAEAGLGLAGVATGAALPAYMQGGPFDLGPIDTDLLSAAQFSDLLNIDPSKLSGDPLTLADYGVTPHALHQPLPALPADLTLPLSPGTASLYAAGLVDTASTTTPITTAAGTSTAAAAAAPASATTATTITKAASSKAAKDKASAASAVAGTPAVEKPKKPRKKYVKKKDREAAAKAAAEAAAAATAAAQATASASPAPGLPGGLYSGAGLGVSPLLAHQLAIPTLDDINMTDALMGNGDLGNGVAIVQPADKAMLDALMAPLPDLTAPHVPVVKKPRAATPGGLSVALAHTNTTETNASADSTPMTIEEEERLMTGPFGLEQDILLLPPPETDPQKVAAYQRPLTNFATLIYAAIKSSDRRRMTLAQIYNHICTHHPFYRYCQDGWQHSIRNNLSLNKAFKKVEPEAEDITPLGIWAVDPEQEAMFDNGVFKRKAAAQGDSVTQGSPLLVKDGRLSLSAKFFRGATEGKAEQTLRLLRLVVQRQYGLNGTPDQVEKMVKVLTLALATRLRRSVVEAQQEEAAATAATTAATTSAVVTPQKSGVPQTPSTQTVPRAQQAPLVGGRPVGTAASAAPGQPAYPTNAASIIRNPALPLTTAQIQGLQQTPTKAFGFLPGRPVNMQYLPVSGPGAAGRPVQTGAAGGSTTSSAPRMSALQQMQALRNGRLGTPGKDGQTGQYKPLNVALPVAGPSTLQNKARQNAMAAGAAGGSPATPGSTAAAQARASASPAPGTPGAANAAGKTATPKTVPQKRGADGTAGASTTTAATGQHTPVYTGAPSTGAAHQMTGVQQTFQPVSVTTPRAAPAGVSGAATPLSGKSNYRPVLVTGGTPAYSGPSSISVQVRAQPAGAGSKSPSPATAPGAAGAKPGTTGATPVRSHAHQMQAVGGARPAVMAVPINISRAPAAQGLAAAATPGQQRPAVVAGAATASVPRAGVPVSAGQQRPISVTGAQPGAKPAAGAPAVANAAARPAGAVQNGAARPAASVVGGAANVTARPAVAVQQRPAGAAPVKQAGSAQSIGANAAPAGAQAGVARPAGAQAAAGQATVARPPGQATAPARPAVQAAPRPAQVTSAAAPQAGRPVQAASVATGNKPAVPGQAAPQGAAGQAKQVPARPNPPAPQQQQKTAATSNGASTTATAPAAQSRPLQQQQQAVKPQVANTPRPVASANSPAPAPNQQAAAAPAKSGAAVVQQAPKSSVAAAAPPIRAAASNASSTGGTNGATVAKSIAPHQQQQQQQQQPTMPAQAQTQPVAKASVSASAPAQPQAQASAQSDDKSAAPANAEQATS